MVNSQRMLATILLTLLMGRIDAFAIEHSTPGQDIKPPATATSFVVSKYRPNPWVPGVVLPPSMASMNNRAVLKQQASPAPQVSAPKKQRSVARKVFGAIIGATGGFFGGAYLGAAIEGDCNCDDPGLRGALIGAPIGGVTGGILGYKFLF